MCECVLDNVRESEREFSLPPLGLLVKKGRDSFRKQFPELPRTKVGGGI